MADESHTCPNCDYNDRVENDGEIMVMYPGYGYSDIPSDEERVKVARVSQAAKRNDFYFSRLKDGRTYLIDEDFKDEREYINLKNAAERFEVNLSINSSKIKERDELLRRGKELAREAEEIDRKLEHINIRE